MISNPTRLVFSSPTDLLNFAKQFLDARLSSLEKDVKVCLAGDAAFPAILYCFSTIDLLGALYEGDATGNTRRYGQRVGTTAKAKQYMVRMLGYPAFETELLQKIFRHRTVHLAQPKVVVLDRRTGWKITWRYEHTYSGKHMTVEDLKGSKPITILTPSPMTCDHLFIISIEKLVEDIKESVYRTNGYLDQLAKNQTLRSKFEKAVNQIYDPST